METRLGCLRSGPELQRFPLYAWPRSADEPDFAPSVDLGAKMMPIYDQGNLGSCTAQAIGAALEYVNHWQPGLQNLGLQPNPEPFTIPSRLFLYYNGRAEVGMENLDWGLSIVNCIDAVARYGFAPESDWPYNVSQFAVKPPVAAYASGNKERLTMFPRRIALDLRMCKMVLSFGYPIVFGVAIENRFMAYMTDLINGQRVIKIPRDPVTTIGTHAMVICGYREDLRAFQVRNSWSDAWGEGGYCWMPYDYLLDPRYAFDMFYIWGTTN